ncbi:4-hydroxythreonine-4-phosphate dehydrogenase PdxA [Ameyamaea chiangmaiensis]|uniref:4-hydroxythreonine-4-phosphate dehydrogenase n=2 Tax=Ameyamaea chiangmaiensis TaxID=442969 RepID=A0A850PDT2_9PROT|nr:4-hydroxythreonine-4-phosphate dehydrogenase PdxA [Ameyamaea chiangmaiensis]MBS4073803.1 4-hydroxythreonine-4-phosphate dehydrogenase PdxA [Ameyamaea chiangmaiensis]NVN39201.1 4-hydroxythreonine-4-phosphate dehydrogenase PdxA [Ameyamaea chiangmaiensis]
MTGRPPIGLTMGDPAGIGPELTYAAWHALRQTPAEAFVLFGDPASLPKDAPHKVIATPDQAWAVWPDAIPVMQGIRLTDPVQPGVGNPAHAPAIIDSIARAVAAAQAGATGGVVTNPINKYVLRQGGFIYPGHTEFLADLCGVPGHEVMMLAGPSLRVVPVTIHVSLRTALDQLRVDEIVRVARTTHHALRRDFGLPSPRLAVAGLNPHAGEGGLMGTEEEAIILPALSRLRQDGIDVTGPWPPDTMFTPTARADYDAAICMYHDQALIPLKTLDMDNGVNVTLGLPIIRTSPDHGTAFDIAGRGIARPDSLIAALRLATSMTAHRSPP